MISFSKFATAISLVAYALSSASATPISERATTCKPNFEGNRETIYVPLGGGLVNEWTQSSVSAGATIKLVQQSQSTAFPKGEFLVPFTGDAAGTYQFKLVGDTERRLLLTASSSGQLHFANPNGSDPSQIWKIECDKCPPTGTGKTSDLRASGCTISNPFTKKCITGSEAGDTLFLSECVKPSSQQYSFISGN